MNRALVAGALACYIGIVYAVIVVGVGRGSGRTALSVLATAVVAVTFERVRAGAQRLANRLTFGQRRTPLEVISQLSRRVARTYDAGTVLGELARVTQEGTGAARAVVWLRVGETLTAAAAHPSAGSPLGRTAALPPTGIALPPLPGGNAAISIEHGGELLGAIAITRRSQEARHDARLLADIASAAGLVLHNLRLTGDLAARVAQAEAQAAELRASRTRIVEAQDAERRRIERDIHDGAQQHLVAFAVKLRMARSLAERDLASARTLVADLRADNDVTLETLRDLSRGIYPALLADKGPAAALRAQCKRSPIPVTIQARRVGRFSPEAEAAAYFVCMEAVQNAAKHSRASAVNVELRGDAKALLFTVADHGAGFDPAAVPAGSGLINMADRISAVGGSIEIDSAPDRGTTISGRIPSTGSIR